MAVRSVSLGNTEQAVARGIGLYWDMASSLCRLVLKFLDPGEVLFKQRLLGRLVWAI